LFLALVTRARPGTDPWAVSLERQETDGGQREGCSLHGGADYRFNGLGFAVIPPATLVAEIRYCSNTCE
jgi:hypothetical protein